MSKTLVRKSRGGQQLQAFDLSEVGSLAESEEVEKLRNVVSSNSNVSMRRNEPSDYDQELVLDNLPDVVVVAILSKAGANRSTLLLDDGSLVGNRLGRTHIANKLLYCI